MATEDKDRLSMPVRIERIEFFDDMPQLGELVSCAARVRNVGEQAVSADLELTSEERLFVRIDSDQQGRPRVVNPHDADVEVSIAHKNGRAVALASIGRSPGIDIEEIAHRSDAFVERAFSVDEVARVPNGDVDGWLTRFWSAREAVGKARGTGLAGVGTELTITAVDGDRVEVDGEWVETRQKGGMVVAWTT